MTALQNPVSSLKGVGKTRSAQLAQLGIESVYDLIAYFPRRYEDRSRVIPIGSLEPDVPSCICAVVVSEPRNSYFGGRSITRIRVADDTGQLNISYFNQSYLADSLTYGERYYFFGTLPGDSPYRQMTNPVTERADTPPVNTRRIVPVYRLTSGLSNKVLSKLILNVLDTYLDLVPEILPEQVLSAEHLCGVREAYRNIHDPMDAEALELARKRLVFEEFYIFAAGLKALRDRRVTRSRAPYTKLDLQPLLSSLPFSPTGAQMRAMEEIRQDLASGTPMNRLLQGDVGSGKTIVAAAAACLASINGEQSAFMAPTEILAEQHLRSLSPLLEPLGVRCALLTGSMKESEKKHIREALASGDISLVIGTHALISERTVFSRLGLVIADEQHRFGVEQRGALGEKGDAPHMLFMSATPIPRTMSMLLYGDLNVSVLDELPPGRQKIETYLVNEQMRSRINNFIRRQVDEGHQVYIVCPAIEEGEDESLKSAELWAETLQRSVFPDRRVALLHGRMKGQEKEAVMRSFADGETDILVATTVIEVGVDVPNATLMVIENAERFGLSQLHQLRGRVGRGSAESYCVLFSENKNPDTQARLKALCATNDGFAIAEQDLMLRGPGDFFGSQQHGLPAFKVANLSLDVQTLQRAKAAAERADLSDPASPLAQRIDMLFSHGTPVLN